MVDPLTTSAISWGFSAASWLISPVLSRLLNKCFDALGIDPQFQSQQQILLDKLETLQTTLLPKLLILTDAAQQSTHRLILQKWLQKLKSAFYEAEHVLGLIEYKRLEKEVNSLFPSTSKCSFKKLIGKLPKFSFEKKYLIKRLDNLEKIVNEGMEFVALLNLPSSSGNTLTHISNEQYRKTISASGSTVIGREKDRDYIVKLLREDIPESSSNAKCYSVIGIWGMGGLGKTTLAQYVCEHEKEVKYFDYVIWVYVSEKFNVRAIMEKMWESVSDSGSSSHDYKNFDVLITQLADKLRGKKYFLVLDDVWCDKGVTGQELEQIFVPLRAGKTGSKILVTTQIEAAAKALSAINPILLRELDDEQFMSLFISNAIGDVQISDNHMKGRLISIGKKIAAKLYRSPLAAKTVAAQLRMNPYPEFWESMLNRSLKNDTMGALFLSYQHLPPPLQRCFAFCSLFPKGHEFEHDYLVNLWIAEGFIETEDSNEHMKDIGNRCILELISSSFFQVIEKWGRKYYFMHDLIHDLAQDVSEGEYFRIEIGDENKEIPAHTRHICVERDILREYVEKICKLKDLRTIIVSGWWYSVLLKEGDLDALFTKLRKLYVVEIEGISPDVKRVSKSLFQLRNLCYLSLRNSESEYLNLDAHSELLCHQLRFLCTDSLISNVGRLILLQELERFDVRMERGFEVKQLEHLKDLYGLLSISGLHNVKSKEEADRAKLSDKKGLRKLIFDWDYEIRNVLRDNDVKILDGLCPPPQIKELTIKYYRGERFPRWISENNNNVIHLQHLELWRCDGLKSWEPLPVNLTHLEISSCLSLVFVVKEDLDMIMSTKGTRISKIVTFKEMTNTFDNYFSVDYQFKEVRKMMKYGDDIEEETLSTISKDLNKCLEKRLDLICKHKDVYDELFLPSALERLKIEDCIITDKILARSLQGLTSCSLTHLKLKDIITITCIPKKVLSSLTNLLNLQIEKCIFLTSIGGLDTHSTLKELSITRCPNLTTIETSIVAASCSDTFELTSSSRGRRTRSSSTLKCVELRSCMLLVDMLLGSITLEGLVIGDTPTMVNPHIGNFKALSVLILENCPNLASLRGLNKLTNLERLEVLSGCDKLECYSDADKLPQLKELRIYRISLLEQLVSTNGFSSLVSLELYHAQQECFSKEECDAIFCNLSSLTKITFWGCKMRSLPNLMGLHSLISIWISYCENLSSLPDVLPPVKSIHIDNCNEEFTRSCKDTNHINCRKISRIPGKYIR